MVNNDTKEINREILERVKTTGIIQMIVENNI